MGTYKGGASLFPIENGNLPRLPVDPTIASININLEDLVLHRVGNLFAQDDSVQIIANLKIYTDSSAGSGGTANATVVFASELSPFGLGQVSLPLDNASLFQNYHLSGKVQGSEELFYVTKIDLTLDIKKNKKDAILVSILKSLAAASKDFPLPTPATSITKDIANTFTTFANDLSNRTADGPAVPGLSLATIGLDFSYNGTSYNGKTGAYAIIFGKYEHGIMEKADPNDSRQRELAAISKMTLKYDPKAKLIIGIAGGNKEPIYNDYAVITVGENILHPKVENTSAGKLSAKKGKKSESQLRPSRVSYNSTINESIEGIGKIGMHTPEMKKILAKRGNLTDQELHKAVASINKAFSRRVAFKDLF